MTNTDRGVSEVSEAVRPQAASVGGTCAGKRALGRNRLPVGALIAAVVGSGVLAMMWPYQPSDDALVYDRLAHNLMAGHGFSVSAAPPFTPTMQREPAYPLFLSGVFLIAGPGYGAVQLVQMAFFVLTVLLIYRIAQRVADERTAQLAAWGTALAPPLVNYPTYLLSETLFTVLLVGLVWALMETVSRAHLRWFMLAGVLWGLTVLCKAIMAPFGLLIGAVWMAASRRGVSPSGRSLVVGALVFLLSASCLVAPWVVRNYRRFGVASITSLRGSKAIWERSRKLSYNTQAITHQAVYGLSEYLGHRFYPEAAAQARDVLLRESAMANQRQAELAAAGYSEAAIDHTMLAEALEPIRHHPLRYVAQSTLEAIKLTAVLYVPLLNEPMVEARFRQLPSGDILLSVLRGGFRLLAFALLVLALIGACAVSPIWPRWLLVFLPIVFLNVAYALTVGLGRYAVPLLPYYCLLGAVGWQCLRTRQVAAVVTSSPTGRVR